MLPSRLYAILDTDSLEARGLVPLDVLGAWLDAGVRLIQLRAKPLSSGAMLELAAEIVARGTAAGATVIVNDRADVARMAGAAGVHVGQDDLCPADVRSVIGARALVGLSTHSGAQVDAALREPISYVAIGPVYATASKGGATDPPVGLQGVRDAAARAAGPGLPVVAIGGITLDRAPEVLAAGASAVAVISDLLTGDIAARARAYLDVLQGARPPG